MGVVEAGELGAGRVDRLLMPAGFERVDAEAVGAGLAVLRAPGFDDARGSVDAEARREAVSVALAEGRAELFVEQFRSKNLTASIEPV